MTSFLPLRVRAFIAARLSPEEATGLHLTVGVALMLVAAWLFGDIAEDVVNGDKITLLDVQIARWLHVHALASERLTQFMLFITHWHGMLGGAIMGTLLAAWFRSRKQHYWMLATFFVVAGGNLLNVLLKYVFHRTRPSFDDPLLALDTYSFPSGHTVNAALLYGLIGCWLWQHYRSGQARAAVVAGWCTMVALVGFSRMYLGAHYVSDVLAAATEGLAWLAICVTAISTLRRRRAVQDAINAGRRN